MAVKWERLERLSADTSSVTGTDREEAEAATKRAEVRMAELRARPLMILICDELGTCEVAERLEEKVWKNKQVSLATRAFRMVRMSPDDAAKESLLKGHGKVDPRLIFLDLARDKVVVLEGKRVDVRPIFAAMKKVSKPFYKENLDGVVRKHVKLLAEHDKIHPRVLQARERLSAEKDSDSTRAKKLKQKLEVLEKEQEKIRSNEVGLWKLTPRVASAKKKAASAKKSS